MTTLATAPTSHAASRRISLDELFQRGQHGPLLNLALGELARRPDDVPLAVQACRAYIAMGLIDPAREMLDAPGAPLAGMSEFDELRGQLAELPSNRVDWASLAERFAQNLRRLYAAHPLLRMHEATFRGAAERFELFRGRGGALFVRHVPDELALPGVSAWYPDLLDADAVVRGIRLPHEGRGLLCPPYLVTMDRFGRLFELVFDQTAKMFLTFSPRVYVLEPDANAFALTLWTAASVERYCHERVDILLGPDAVERLRDVVAGEGHRLLPEHLMYLPGPTPPPQAAIQSAVQAIVADRQAATEAVVERIEAAYATVTAAEWARRFADAADHHGSLRILGITSRFTTVLQYTMRDLRDALEAQGHYFRLLIEPSDHDVNSAMQTAEAIAAFRPDLVVLIDHHRREHRPQIPANVPFVCWIQDQLPNLTDAAVGRELGPLDFYIAAEPEAYARLYAYPREQGLRWSMPTNDRVFIASPAPADALAAHRCDVSYASNQSTTPAAFVDEQRRRHAHVPDVARMMGWCHEALQAELAEEPRRAFAGPTRLLIERGYAALGIAPFAAEVQDKLSRYFIHPLRELMYRQQALAWVADYCDRTGRRLHLYGNGWEAHPRLRSYARGYAVNGEQMRAIYQASAVNLQITAFGAMHPRLLDGLAAGGFFLIRYTPLDDLAACSQRLLAVMAERGIEPGRNYCAADEPALAAAWRDYAARLGDEPMGETIRLHPGAVAELRSRAAGGFRLSAGAVFGEDYGAVAFDSAAGVARLLDRYLNDAEGRRAIAGRMRQRVVEQYSYRRMVADLLSFLRDRLAAVAAASA